MAACARALARFGVHPRSEVGQPLLGDPLVGSSDRPGVLLEAMKQDDEVAGALVQKAVSGKGERRRDDC
jgi:hypothetical protein